MVRFIAMTVQTEGDSANFPESSRALRKSSLKKRLETQKKLAQPKVRQKTSKKYRLSRYRRKCENAKERQRMKKFNEAFDTLRKLLPNTNIIEEDKDTKVDIEYWLHFI